MKKAILILLVLVTLCSCGTKSEKDSQTMQSSGSDVVEDKDAFKQEQPTAASTAPDSDMIKSDLPEEILIEEIYDPFNGYSEEYFNLSSLEIEKRKTDNKTDAVWCIVKMENSNYQSTKYVLCNYSYYDVGGWILDSWEYYQDSDVNAIEVPFNIGEIASYLANVHYPNISASEIAGESNTYVYEFSSWANYANADVSTSGIYALQLDGHAWRFSPMQINEESVQWNIVGEWALKADRNYLISSDCHFSLNITNFDSDALVGSGACTIGYESEMNSRSLGDALQIRESDDCLYIVFSIWEKNENAPRDYIRISYNEALVHHADWSSPICKID